MCSALAADREVRTRFEREARAAARIKSRYVTRVYDIGELPDLRPYIVMEYMEGETLSEALQAVRTMPLADTVRIIGQVGRGLARAHELGIVHRDIKPDNIFLAHTAEDGVVAKVFDFGIVKVSDTPSEGATREGMLIGTPHYMSPEQADGLLNIDQRSDVYSLGVVAFRMLTGKRPFQGDSVIAILVKICGSPLPSLVESAPAIPPSVDAWFQRTCARDCAERFATVLECVDALANAAGIAEVEGLRDVSLLPPPPSIQAPVPEDISCPTLLEELPDVLDGSEGDFFDAAVDTPPWDSSAPRAPFGTNPLFEGEREAKGAEDSMSPQALDQERGGAAGRGLHARARVSRSTLIGIAATASILAILLTTRGSATNARDDGNKSAAVMAPPERPPVPAVPLASTPTDSRGTRERERSRRRAVGRRPVDAAARPSRGTLASRRVRAREVTTPSRGFTSRPLVPVAQPVVGVHDLGRVGAAADELDQPTRQTAERVAPVVVLAQRAGDDVDPRLLRTQLGHAERAAVVGAVPEPLKLRDHRPGGNPGFLEHADEGAIDGPFDSVVGAAPDRRDRVGAEPERVARPVVRERDLEREPHADDSRFGDRVARHWIERSLVLRSVTRCVNGGA